MRFVFVTIMLLIGAPAYADGAAPTTLIPYQTDVMCENTYSKIISHCIKKYGITCEKKTWYIEDREIELETEGFRASSWACLPGKDGQRIIFYGGNGGNCEDCEKFSVWDPHGKKVSGWKSIQKAYGDGGFPKVSGRAFWKQFHDIAIGQQTSK